MGVPMKGRRLAAVAILVVGSVSLLGRPATASTTTTVTTFSNDVWGCEGHRLAPVDLPAGSQSEDRCAYLGPQLPAGIVPGSASATYSADHAGHLAMDVSAEGGGQVGSQQAMAYGWIDAGLQTFTPVRSVDVVAQYTVGSLVKTASNARPPAGAPSVPFVGIDQSHSFGTVSAYTWTASCTGGAQPTSGGREIVVGDSGTYTARATISCPDGSLLTTGNFVVTMRLQVGAVSKLGSRQRASASGQLLSATYTVNP